MFERYTEDARKSIFYARFEASQCGSAHIEPAHVLAGILQADGALALRLLGSPEKVDSVRQRLIRPAQQSSPPQVDIPFSIQGKRVLAYAAEECERLNQHHIACLHVMVGLIRETGNPAAAVLSEMGITLERLRKEAARVAHDPAPAEKPGKGAEWAALVNRLRDVVGRTPAKDFSQDLTAAAEAEALDPLIGREAELQRILEVLLRRNRNWVALTGEPGVGKTAVLAGLAQQFTFGGHPALVGRRVISVPAALLSAGRNYCESGPVLCLEGLFDLEGEQAAEAIGTLQACARRNALIVGTGSAQGFARLPEAIAALFEQVDLAAPGEAEAQRIVAGMKEKYENFHAVSIAEDAIPAAVTLSRRFRSLRQLPDRALDLLDDACAHARLHKKNRVTPEDIAAAIAAR